MNYFIVLLRDATNFRRANVTRQRRSGDRAFTLSELLVVMAVISVMSAAAMPALRTILDTRSITTGAYDLAGMLEYARSEAVARQTYVWVGATTEVSAGQTSTVFVPVYSRDGTSTNVDPSNLVPLSMPLRLTGMKLVPWTQLKASTRALVSETPISVCDSTAGIKFTVGTRTFDGQTITYTPGGEVLLRGKVTSDDGYITSLDLSFQKIKGQVVPANSEDAALIVQGSTGAVKIVRVQ